MHSIKRPLSQCGRRHSPRTTAASAVPAPEQSRLSRIPRQSESRSRNRIIRTTAELEDENAARADACAAIR